MFSNAGRNNQRNSPRDASRGSGRNHTSHSPYHPSTVSEFFGRGSTINVAEIADRLGMTPRGLSQLLEVSAIDNRALSRLRPPARGNIRQCSNCELYPARGHLFCDRHRESQAVADLAGPPGRRDLDKQKGPRMKDVAIRGKNYSIRVSFLTDNEKFESTVVKMADKKPVEALPEKIVQLMIDFINTEVYVNSSLTDEIHLYIVAATCNVKSLMKHIMERLKDDRTFDAVGRGEIVDICCLVCIPPEADAPLKEWLKTTFLKQFAPGYEGPLDINLVEWDEFQDACIDHPQLHRTLAEVLGTFHDRPGRRKPRMF